MTRPVTLTINAGAATITLSQPEIRNAFSDEVIAEITAAFETVAQHIDVRAVILAAEGPAFCAGANLNWMRRMADYSREENVVDAGKLATMMHTIYTCPHPTIARVQGDVYAGGMGLVAACDMAVAVETAHFCLSEVKIGLIPATIAPYVLRAIGPRHALRYFQSGERFSAQRALAMGLVTEVCECDQLDATVAQLIGLLLGGAPLAQQSAKDLIAAVDGCPIDAAISEETAQRIARQRATSEAKDGISAFLEKRTPAWLL